MLNNDYSNYHYEMEAANQEKREEREQREHKQSKKNAHKKGDKKRRSKKKKGLDKMIKSQGEVKRSDNIKKR